MIDETVLKRNNLIYTIPVLKRLFKISFDLFITPSDKVFTQGTDNSRLPGIFVGSHNKFYIAMHHDPTTMYVHANFFSKSVLTEELKR